MAPEDPRPLLLLPAPVALLLPSVLVDRAVPLRPSLLEGPVLPEVLLPLLLLPLPVALLLLSVLVDHTSNNTYILGDGNKDTVTADNTTSDTIKLGSGDGDTVCPRR